MRIDGYVLGEPIGQGATGVVYEAHQTSPGRAVALKLLRPELAGPRGLRRFRREAEVLGWLDHDGIARVYGAGTADTSEGPVAYMALELVRGQRLDRWADARGLDLHARLDLLLQLCDAVAHAHGKCFVHRDLKPANVLVTDEGRVKVLDFGIARLAPARRPGAGAEATDEPTRTAAAPGTLAYASPEQVDGAAGPADARSDVYALGVIAYELLTGRLPVDVAGAPLPEAARRIREDAPVPLGRLDRRLRRDLETIVAKALAKDPSRRYPSADALADDVRRHLANEPITARATGRHEQLARFARRNRGLVAGAAAAFAALLAGAGTSAALSVRASRLLAETTVEAETAEEVLGFLEDVFAQSDPLVQEVSVAEVTRQAAARLRDDFADRPAVRARLVWVLGRTLSQLELPDEAAPLVEEALALREALHGASSSEVADALQRLGRVRLEEQRYAEAAELQRRCLAIRRGRSERGEPLADALSGLAASLAGLERAAEAESLQAEALAELDRVLPPDDPRVLRMHHDAGVFLTMQGRLAEAEAEFRHVLAAGGRAVENQRIHALIALGDTLRLQRRDQEAVPLLREAVALADEHYGATTRLARVARSALAGQLAALGEVDESVAILRAVHAATVARHGPDSPLAALALHDLAFALHELPDKTEAEAKYLESIERLEAAHGPDESLVFQAQHDLSILYLDLGRSAEAEAWERRSLEGRARVLGPDDERTLISLRGLGVLLFRQGRFGEAVELRRELLERLARTQGEGSALTQDARLGLANALRAGGALAQAEAELLAVRAALPGLPAPEETAARMRAHLRDLYQDWGRPDDAARWAEPAR